MALILLSNCRCSLQVIHTLRTQCPRCPTIQHLTLLFPQFHRIHWDFDLELQHELVSSVLAETFPNVILAKIQKGIEWRRQNSRSTQWRPFIPLRHRDGFKRSIYSHISGKNRSSYQISDFGCCFSSLFSPGEMDDTVRQALCLAI